MFDTLWAEIISTVGPYIPRVVAAIAVLVAGWAVSYSLASIVRRALVRTDLDNRLAALFAGEEKVQKMEVEHMAGRMIYYLAMVFVLIAVFQVLGLTFVSQPLNVLLSQIFAFVPRILSAGILIVIAWALATGVRTVVTRVLASSNVEQRVRGGAPVEEEGSLPESVGEALYWFIFVLFLPGILGALALEGMMAPVRDMLSQVIGFLPNLFTAGLTLFLGWIVAGIVRTVATGFLAAVGLDGLADRAGLTSALGGQPASRIVGVVVYVLVFIPILISALTALGLESVSAPLSGMLETVLNSIPTVFAAILVLAISYAVGRIVAELVTKVLSGTAFDAVLEKVGLGRLPPEGKASQKPSAIVGSLVLTVILLLATMEAAEILGFAALSTMIVELLTIAARIVFGIVLFGVGLFVAKFVADTVTAAGAPHSGLLGGLARVAILVLSGAIALRQMGFANEIVNLAFGAIVGAIAVALSIAFGIGGRELAAKQLDSWSRKIQE